MMVLGLGKHTRPQPATVHVSILLVMDDGLGAQKLLLAEIIALGLNPSCNG